MSPLEVLKWLGVGLSICLVLAIIAIVVLDRRTREIRVGIFFEREREREDWPDPSAKTEILWRHPSDAPTTIPGKED